MREVKISLTGWTLADAMGELRKWLDHHDCVPVKTSSEESDGCSWCGSCSPMMLPRACSSVTLEGDEGIYSAAL